MFDTLRKLIRPKHHIKAISTLPDQREITRWANDELGILLKELERKDRAEYRRKAAIELGQLGPEATPAIPALLLAAVDPDQSVRLAAEGALQQIDPNWYTNPGTLKTIPQLVQKLLGSPDPVVGAATKLLVKIGPSAVPDLVEALATGEDTIYKVFIIRVLAKLGLDAVDAVPELSRALSSQYLQVRLAAANAISKFGPAAETALPKLVETLSDPYAACRAAAANCLGSLGIKALPAVPALILLLGDREDEVRQAAAKAVEKIGPEAIPALIEYIQLLDLRRLNARYASMEDISTWAMKPAPKGMIADFQEIWANLSWWIYDLVGDINRVELAQQTAITILGKFGSSAEPAIPTIVQALSDPNPNILLAAIQALGKIGSIARCVIPDLFRLMGERESPFFSAIQDSVENIDEAWRSHPAVVDLIATLALQASNPANPRCQAWQIIVWIGYPAVPALIDLLSTGPLPTRENAAIALGQVGKDAKEAIPALTEALNDENRRVQTVAAIALERIRSQLS